METATKPEKNTSEASDISCWRQLVDHFQADGHVKLHVLLWAYVATTVSVVLLPPFIEATPRPRVLNYVLPLEVDAGLLTINYTGALGAGLVAAILESADAFGLSQEDSSVLATLKAFRGGFLSQLTSYLAVVEHMGELLKRRHFPQALLTFSGIYVVGPILFTVSLVLWRMFWRRHGTRIWKRSSPRAEPSSNGILSSSAREKQGKLKRIRTVLVGGTISICLMGLIADEMNPDLFPEVEAEVKMQVGQGLPGRWKKATYRRVMDLGMRWDLPANFACTSVAFLLAELITILINSGSWLQELAPSINWVAVSLNAISLLIWLIFFKIEQITISDQKFSFLYTIHEASGGAISCYASFAEAVALPALSGNWKGAVANWVINAYIACFGLALGWAMGLF